MDKPKLYTYTFEKIYELLVAKAERKNRTREEVNEIINWLTGYDDIKREEQIGKQVTMEAFMNEAPMFNENSKLIKGVICGHRVEEIEDGITRKIRYLDKLIDELAKGKSMEKILRK